MNIISYDKTRSYRWSQTFQRLELPWRCNPSCLQQMSSLTKSRSVEAHFHCRYIDRSFIILILIIVLYSGSDPLHRNTQTVNKTNLYNVWLSLTASHKKGINNLQKSVQYAQGLNGSADKALDPCPGNDVTQESYTSLTLTGSEQHVGRRILTFKYKKQMMEE